MLLYSCFLGSSIYLIANTAQNISSSPIAKIISYAQNSENFAPTLKEYTDANISGINLENIAEINQKIVQIEMDNGDTTYKYPPNLDYNYTFKNSNMKTIPLLLKNNQINMQDTKVENNTTVLLKINIKQEILGKYFTPHITIMYENKSYIHTLEAGAEGIRYLNISALALQPNSSIELKTNFVMLEDQEVALMVFKNPTIKNKKILIIAPHPDDAEIAAFGLYSEHPEQTYIITITAGDAGPTDIYTDVFSTPQEQFNYKGEKTYH